MVQYDVQTCFGHTVPIIMMLRLDIQKKSCDSSAFNMYERCVLVKTLTCLYAD